MKRLELVTAASSSASVHASSGSSDSSSVAEPLSTTVQDSVIMLTDRLDLLVNRVDALTTQMTHTASGAVHVEDNSSTLPAVSGRTRSHSANALKSDTIFAGLNAGFLNSPPAKRKKP